MTKPHERHRHRPRPVRRRDETNDPIEAVWALWGYTWLAPDALPPLPRTIDELRATLDGDEFYQRYASLIVSYSEATPDPRSDVEIGEMLDWHARENFPPERTWQAARLATRLAAIIVTTAERNDHRSTIIRIAIRIAANLDRAAAYGP